MKRTRVPRKRLTPRRIHPERSGGHLRERLHGAAREKRREEVFQRAKGRCEEWILGDKEFFDPLGNRHVMSLLSRCPNRATEWSHMRHGSNKCDCLDINCNLASCHECHVKRHNSGGKPITVRKKDIYAQPNGN